MSLSKQQLLGAVGAGIFVVGVGGFGFMFYSSFSERGEAEESLESQMSAYNNYHSAAVFPSKKSIDSVKSNATSYAAWYDSAVALASRGDKAFPEESPPVFKQRLQAEVRRMSALEGGRDGKIAAPTFLFGFEQYLGEGGVLPKSEDVPTLASQLDTIASVVDIFAEAGIVEIKSIRRIEDKKDGDEDEDAPRNKKKKANKKGAEEESGPKTTCLKYAFEFTTRPAALVTTLNRLTASERFLTVKHMSFKETSDFIVDRLNAIRNAEQQKAGGKSASGGGRRGRRGSSAASSAVTIDAATGAVKIDPLVVDPELDAPIQVNFTLEVRDFGRAALAAKAEEAKPAEEKKEDK